MKKYLLGTAVMALSLGFTISSAIANGTASKESTSAAVSGIRVTKPELTISGEAIGCYHWFDNSDTARGEKGLGTLFAIEDSRLNFQATGRMDVLDHMFYDWLLGITGDTNETKNILENRLRLKGRWGTFLFGNHQGVENFMARGAFAVVGGTGGFDGNFKTTTSRPTGLYMSTDMVGTTKYATKLSYVTPRFYGFQAGFSFTPNSEHKGEGSNGEPHNRTSTKTPKEPFDINVVALGLNFKHTLDCGLNFSLSGTTVFGTTKPPASGPLNATNVLTVHDTTERHNTRSYAIGGVVEYQGFEVGAEWIDSGKSQQIKNASDYRAAGYTGSLGSFDAGEAFSVAAAYSFGANKLAYGYYHSERKFNGKDIDANIHSVTYDRAIVPGFSIFAEGIFFDLDGHKAAVDLQNAIVAAGSTAPLGLLKNDGRTLVAGAKFKF